MRSLGIEVLATAGDVSSGTDVHGFVDAVQERFGRVDILVNNAGISLLSPAEETVGGPQGQPLVSRQRAG